MKKFWKSFLTFGILALAVTACSQLFDDGSGLIVGGVPRYTIDLPNGTKIPVTAGSTDKKLDDILKDAGLLDSSDKVNTSKTTTTGKPNLDGFVAIKPDGTSVYVQVDSNGELTLSSGGLPAGTVIKPVTTGNSGSGGTPTPNKIITVKVTDINGNEKQIPVEVDASATTATWKEIKDAADRLGISIKTPTQENGYTFTGDWEKGSTKLDNNTAVTSNETITPIYTKQVSFKVGDKTVKFTAKYPDAGEQKLDDLLAEAKNQGFNDNPSDTATQKFTGWTVTKPDGTKVVIAKGDVASNTEKFPAGSIIAAQFTDIGKSSLVYTVNGKNVTYQVTGENVTQDAFNNILNEAVKKHGAGVKDNYPNVPAGYTKKWTVASGTAPTSDTDTANYERGTVFTVVYEKTVTFKVDKDGNGEKDKSFTVQYPNSEEKSLKELLVDSGNVTDPKALGKTFKGWKVSLPNGTTKTVTSADINNAAGNASGTFPVGTKIEPIFEVDTTGGADRTLTLGQDASPQPGDKVVKDDNNDTIGKIIGKNVTTDDGKLLGYVYKVEGDKVFVVAKKSFANLGWAHNEGGKVYTGINDNVHLYDRLGDISSGYDAWLKIENWNTTADVWRYEAIKQALCYPLEKGQTGYPADDANGNAKVKQLSEGKSVQNRWYLPSEKELQDIYDTQQYLANWDAQLKGKDFWSANVSKTKDTDAMHVDFNESDKTKQIKSADKKTKKYVVPVAQFNFR